ncbi:hypothetical protein JOF29_004642 [Kribbella aluminosa]|uniref:Pyrroloquinoline-quinone binding quinoprotein n=1 Tax=Kribbella aluminosa TaxID=416017 RepID=A0ABS4UPH0_9ACTN|nr:hypothetical protein [Kribbella aluminosa]MBP2353532.1 hypothetical protein [Kribbella aluminosa]
MVATTAVTAALILLAGCGGDKKSGSGSDNNSGQSTTSASPTAPSVPTFDPPKAFAIGAAYPVLKTTQYSYTGAAMALVGKVAVAGTIQSLAGHDVTDPSKSWSVQAAPASTTKVNRAVQPKAVKVDGKDVAVVVYSETDKGNGTQKPQGLVVIQWIDVSTGDKLAETSTKTTDDEPSLGNVAYDVDSGQVAIVTSGKGPSPDVTVFADPATKKATLVPGISPAAVHGGVIAGAKSAKTDRSDDAAMVLADGPSGKITKQLAPLQTMFKPLLGTGKHAYFYGMKYVNYDAGTETSAIYAVDLSTGAVVATPPPPAKDSTQAGGWSCFWDQATAVACTGKTGSNNNGTDTIIGFDDATGKKTWGFSNDSGNRNVPDVTAAFHGVLYAKTEAQPVLMDAKTGADLPSAAPSGSPSASDSPSTGDTPSGGDSPSVGATPSDGSTPSDSRTSGNGDLALWDGSLASPESVSQYGAVYKQQPHGDYSVTNELDSVCVFIKATG